MGHLEAGNAAGIEELARRAASTVVTSPAGQATEVRDFSVQPVRCAISIVLPMQYTFPYTADLTEPVLA